MPKQRSERPQRRGRREREYRRGPPTKAARAIVLIVCEGTETEYRYFNALRRQRELLSVTLEVARPGGQSEQLIRHAIELRSERARQPDSLPYEAVWCVLDREAANEPESFPSAVERADRARIELAVSNPCFEYWYLLHFRETDRPFHHADDVYDALRHNDCLPGFEKNHDVFEQLALHMDRAIERAERLYTAHAADMQDRFPNPSTLVQRLIRTIIEPEKRR